LPFGDALTEEKVTKAAFSVAKGSLYAYPFSINEKTREVLVEDRDGTLVLQT
jgi:hypothetical protein